MVGFTIPGVGPDEKTVMKTLTLVGSVLSALGEHPPHYQMPSSDVAILFNLVAGGTNYVRGVDVILCQNAHSCAPCDVQAFSGEYILVFGAIIAHLWNVPPQAYAPQLGSRLHIDHTQLNMIGRRTQSLPISSL